MEAAGVAAAPQKRSVGRRLADLFHGRSRLQVGALLSGPLAWLVILYLGSLAVLLVAAFWSVDALSGELVKGFTFDNYKELWNTDVYRTVALRTIGIATAGGPPPPPPPRPPPLLLPHRAPPPAHGRHLPPL